MALDIDYLADLAIATREVSLKDKTFINLIYDRTRYYAVPMLMREKTINTDPGDYVSVKILNEETGTFQWTGPRGEDRIGTVDALNEAKFYPRWATANYLLDEREQDLNQGEAIILSEIEKKRAQMDAEIIKGVETAWWSKPDSDSDTLTMYGIFMFAVPNETDYEIGEGGFGGGAPAGFTGGTGGITIDEWKNYTGRFADIGGDFFELLDDMILETDFVLPTMESMQEVQTDRWFCCDKLQFRKLKRWAREAVSNPAKGDLSAGLALDTKTGGLSYYGVPIYYIPQLNSYAKQYFIQLDWDAIRFWCPGGGQIVEKNPQTVDLHHTMRYVPTDVKCQPYCIDRRRLGILAGPAWPS